MAKTYAQFKTYITTYIWRDNDTVLAANLDTLIEQANDELDQLTRDWQRRQKTVVIAPESEDFDLTTNVSDFQSIMSLVNNQADSYYRSTKKELSRTNPGHIYQLRAQTASAQLLPWYASDRDAGTLYLRFVAPFSAADPGDLTMQYLIAIPDYSAADSSWLEDEYLNLYLYTVLKHCAMFLREDERVVAYQGLQNEAFEIADLDDKHNLQFGGTPKAMRPHRVVP